MPTLTTLALDPVLLLVTLLGLIGALALVFAVLGWLADLLTPFIGED
jgi:hypothetical protein